MKLVYINGSAWNTIWGNVDFADRRLVVSNIKRAVGNNVWRNVGMNIFIRDGVDRDDPIRNTCTSLQLEDAYSMVSGL